MSPVALAEAVLARIEVTEPVLNAYALITADLALDAARKAEGEIAAGHYRGPLHGIPVAVKDLYDMEGLPTRCSSEVRHDHVTRADSACVERLKAAGAVIVGKTHTHEFAYGIVTPTTANPWTPERIPGGSSGGSGASVAARGCFMGLGSDTGGLDPNPGGALRHGRPQADLRSGQPGGRCLALLVARPTSSR
jgi:aspartyl-tRNA(Asn)/glutamyl-tRNA(Gln) amidotransferase subunit A